MHELLSEIISYVRGALRFRWHALLVAWPVAVLGWLYVFSLPNQYESKAMVFVDTETALKPLLKDLTVQPDMLSEVRMMTAALLSREQLTNIAQKTDLALRASGPLEYENLIDGLRDTIRVSGGANDMFSISYTDTDREMSIRVVATLLDAFMSETLLNNREGTEGAQKFLQQQIDFYAERLTEAEVRLADFKKRNVGLMPGATGDYYERLQKAIEELEETDLAIRVAQNRRNELQRQIDGEVPSFGIVSASGTFREQTGPTDAAGAQIQALQEQRAQLLLRFTENHPDVIALDETIARLEESRVVSQSEAGPANSAGPLELNPVYQNTQMELNAADVELVALRSQRAEQGQTVAVLKASVDTIPEVEAELSRLNRDYEIVREKHQALIDSLEAARLSARADQNKRVDFRIIEPANAPIEPTGPFRGFLLFAVLAAALGAGIGVSVLMHMLRPVFDSVYSLKKEFGLPVIGQIERFRTHDEQRKSRASNVSYGALTAALIVAFGLAVAFQQPGHEFLSALLEKVSAS